MERMQTRFVGVELYFEDLNRAKKFYLETMGLEISDEQPGHHAKFDSGTGFVCLERKGAESYPSADKAVLFFEVDDLGSAIAFIGKDRLVQEQGTWAVLHDPEGHNIVLLERSHD
jgi:predicted enzyme related to lactoylglutathione lyase